MNYALLLPKPRNVCYGDAEFVFVVVMCFCVFKHLVGTYFSVCVVCLDYEVGKGEIVQTPRPIVHLAAVVHKLQTFTFFLRIVVFVMGKRINHGEFVAAVEHVFEVYTQLKIVCEGFFSHVWSAAVTRFV